MMDASNYACLVTSGGVTGSVCSTCMRSVYLNLIRRRWRCCYSYCVVVSRSEACTETLTHTDRVRAVVNFA